MSVINGRKNHTDCNIPSWRKKVGPWLLNPTMQVRIPGWTYLYFKYQKSTCVLAKYNFNQQNIKDIIRGAVYFWILLFIFFLMITKLNQINKAVFLSTVGECSAATPGRNKMQEQLTKNLVVYSKYRIVDKYLVEFLLGISRKLLT